MQNFQSNEIDFSIANSDILQGEATLTLRDAETMEIIREIEVTNTFTIYGTRVNGDSQHHGNKVFSPDSYKDVGISNRKINSSRAMSDLRESYGTSSPTAAGGNIGTNLESPALVTEGTPVPYVQTKARFNSPVSQRTINTIYFCKTEGSVSENHRGISFISLTTPFIQNVNEVLDITYRIQFIDQNTVASGRQYVAGELFNYGQQLRLMNSLATQGTGQYFNFATGLIAPTWQSIPSADSKFNFILTPMDRVVGINTSGGFSTTVYNRTFNSANFRRIFSYNYTLTDYVGKLLKSSSLYGSTDAFTSTVPGSHAFSVAWADLMSSSFTARPVQTIFGHSATSPAPFLDVSYLTINLGAISVNGTSWVNSDFPQFHRIEICKTGNIGVGKYTPKIRKFLGFTGNNYKGSTVTNAFLGKSYDVNLSTGKDMIFDPLRTSQFEHYDAAHYIVFSGVGLTIQNLFDGKYKVFGPTAANVLPISAITQITVVGTTIWVACSNTGLHKIENPLSATPTISEITAISGGCYGVEEGYGNSLWAVFSDGIYKSTDGFATWTIYNAASSPAFSFTGISNNNYANVQHLKIDKLSPTFEMALICKPPVSNALGRKIVWWSTTTSAIAGPSTFLRKNSEPGATLAYHSVKCSNPGSIWCGILEAEGTTVVTTSRLKFGTTDQTTVSTFNGTPVNAVSFYYDQHGVPYVIGSGTAASNSALYNVLDLTSYDILYNGYTSNNVFLSSNDLGILPSNPYSPSILYGFNITEDLFVININASISPYVMTTSVISPTNPDSLNGVSSPFEEMVFDDYRWNGSAWQKNFSQPAVDSSSYVTPAIRVGFKTESHVFTGRSYLDVSGSFPASAFSTSLTFIATIVPQLKSSIQGPSTQVLFAAENATQGINVQYDPSTNKVTIGYSAGTAALTLTAIGTNLASAVGTSVRLAVVINGTSCKAYVNGVLSGTIAIASTFDFSNTTSTKYFIGAKVYTRNVSVSNVFPGNFYAGTMSNVQVWNVAYADADVANDAASPTGVSIPSGAALTNMRSRFLLSETLNEGKLIHSAAETYPTGATIAFTNAVSGTSFYANEYYTYGMFDGLLKDNASTFTHTQHVYFAPTNPNFNQFTSPAETTTVPSTSSQVTELAFWHVTNLLGGDGVPGDFISNGRASGFVSSGLGGGNTGSGVVSYGAIAQQTITADGWVQFSPLSGNEINTTIGLSTNITTGISGTSLTAVTPAVVNYGLYFKSNGQFDVKQLTTVVLANQTYALTDVFKIQRVGTQITYYKNNVLIYTSAVASTGTLNFRVTNDLATSAMTGCGVVHAQINYTLPAYRMYVGSIASSTGKFNPDFLRVEDDLVGAHELLINGTPATIVYDNQWTHNYTAPAVGSIKVTGSGILIFNPSDVGKTITGSATVIQFKL